MVDGFCEENFLDAKNIFEESINSGFELGGSLGFSDPDNHISLGFVMNQMHPGITAWKTATDVAESVYKSLSIIK